MSLVEVKSILPNTTVAQRIVLEEWLQDYRQRVDEFFARLEKYHGHLSEGGTARRWKDNLRKVQWQFCTPGDISTFKDNISTMMDAIQTILRTIQM